MRCPSFAEELVFNPMPERIYFRPFKFGPGERVQIGHYIAGRRSQSLIPLTAISIP
jgi:hypothetical protein